MPANVETMMSVRQVPWHGIGTILEDVVTAEVALKESGLDWTVRKVPTFLPVNYEEGVEPKEFTPVPGGFVTQRESDGRVLGRVGSSYVPLQNTAAFNFFDNVVDSGDAKYETAGSLGGGRRVWLTAKVPDHIDIGGVDNVDVYLLLTNSHDGSSAVTAAVTPVRTVCQNTLNLALAQAQRSWSIRHVSNVEGRVQEARESLDLTFRYTEEFEKVALELLGKKMGEKAFASFADEVVKVFTWSDTRAEKSAEELKAIFFDAENLDSVRGTRWAALNAVGEYLDWYRPTTDVARLKQTWFSIGRNGRDRALQLLTV